MPNRLKNISNRLTFRQFQVFLAVYESKSYSKAGELLGLTQPAVSSQIRALEEAIETQVFEYIGRKLYCTAAGERLALSIDKTFMEIRNLQHDLAELEGVIAGELKLVGVSTAQYIIPYLLRPFLNLNPKININVNITNRSSAIQRLNDNTDDLVIMGMVPEDKPFISLPFLDNELVAVAPKDHPLLKQTSVDASDFLNNNLLLREPGSGSRLALEAYCQKQKLHIEHVMELGSNETIKHAILAGLGVGVLPKLSILPELKLGILQIVELPNFPLKRSWCLVYPNAKQPSPASKAFIDYIQQNIKHFEEYFLKQSIIEVGPKII